MNFIAFSALILSLACAPLHFAEAKSPAVSYPVQIQTRDGKHLSGLIESPTTPPIAAVLLLPGSFNVGMDGDVSGPLVGTGYHHGDTRLSKQIADQLASVGIASLRYSKRGVEDASELPHQIFPYLIPDAISAFQLLKSHYPRLKAGIVGHSEGALIAAWVATEQPVDSLYLLSLPTQPVDEILAYQFVTWPVDLLSSHLDPNQTGTLNLDSTQYQTLLLPQTATSWTQLDTAHERKLSVTEQVIPFYRQLYAQARALISTPQYAPWYTAYQAIKPFTEIAPTLRTKSISIYQGMDDAQIRWSWVLEVSDSFSVKPTLHFFANAGHCFSPMDGIIGEIKTAGPLSSDLLSKLSTDVTGDLKRETF